MRPNLIHPIPVYLKKAEKTLTLQDHNLHEPVGQVRRPQSPTRLIAQISWGTDQKQEASEGGVTGGSSDGYLLFRTSDLRAKRFELELEDRVVQLGDGDAAQKVDLYLSGFKWMGHYPDQRGASLVRAYFEDRGPARQHG